MRNPAPALRLSILCVAGFRPAPEIAPVAGSPVPGEARGACALTDPDPPLYYAIDLVTTKRVPRTVTRTVGDRASNPEKGLRSEATS